MITGPGTAYATALAIGALHGLEPGHGWPVAAVYALGRRRRWISGVAAGALIGGAHLVSSFAVVGAFALLDRWLELTGQTFFSQAAGALLIAMGIWQWRRGRRHAHFHGEGPAATAGLWAIAAFAFAPGFAHEEEVAIIALCAGRASCWGVMGATRSPSRSSSSP